MVVASGLCITGACSGTDNTISGPAGTAGSAALGGHNGATTAQGGSSGPATTTGTGVIAETGGNSGVVTGSGGAMPHGGASGAGGKVGSGGATEPGGASGAGGKVGSGGATGPGGASGAGGKVGSGGATGPGGASGAGGKVGSGGATGPGGASGAGGMIGSGGSSGGGGATGAGGSTTDCVYPSGPYGYLKGDILPPTFAWQGYDGKGQPVSGNAKDVFCNRGGLKALHVHLGTDWCGVCKQVSSQMEEAFQSVLGANWADQIMPLVLVQDGASKNLSSYCAARRKAGDAQGDYYGTCAMVKVPSDHLVSSSYGRADPANPQNLIIIDGATGGGSLMPTTYRVEIATMKIVRLTPEVCGTSQAARTDAEWVKSH